MQTFPFVILKIVIQSEYTINMWHSAQYNEIGCSLYIMISYIYFSNYIALQSVLHVFGKCIENSLNIR